MNAPDQFVRVTAPGRVILDVEGGRDVGPTEAAGLIRECVAHTYRRLDAATARAFDALVEATPGRTDTQGSPFPDSRAERIAHAVCQERGRFLPRFRSEFDRVFEARRDGKPRERAQRGNPASALALVEERDLKEQVALKHAVQAMRTATRAEGFGFDLRARIVMREQPVEGEYENPWGAQFVCDALGNTCRSLWPTDKLWRPIMLHLVIALTPEVAALHRELDALLQDRDILPELRVHTRRRAARDASAPPSGESLYDQVLEHLIRASAHPSNSAWPNADAGESGAIASHPSRTHSGRMDDASLAAPPPSASWSALLDALQLLERGQADAAAAIALPTSDLRALRDGTANALPALAQLARIGDEPDVGSAALEILSAVLNEVFDNPFLPAEIKTVFGRLQLPMLRATLLDPTLLSQPRHAVRRFFDTLAAASVGLRPDHARDGLFTQLADHLASTIRARVTDDLAIFETARSELEVFLDADRAAYNHEITKAIPALIALDDHAAAEASARSAIVVRTAGKEIPPELLDYLDHEGLRWVTSACMEGGPDGVAFRRALQSVDDLLWSVAPQHGPDARRRLVQLIPPLVRDIDLNWPTEDAARARREAFLAQLCALHLDAMKPRPPPAAAESVPTASVNPRGAVPAPSPPLEGAAGADDAGLADSLMRGDWCAFKDDDDISHIAKFAWRAPRGTRLLFTHRDGTIAVIHTPASLARAFECGRASVAVTAVPLFERAMERIIAHCDDIAHP